MARCWWKLWLVVVLLPLSCHRPSPAAKEKGQELRINFRMEPVSLDPRKGNDMSTSQVHFILFEGLLRLESDMSLSPAQAESYEISPDGKTYIFHLREAKWSDGSPVTAQDFERSWKSILDPMFPSPDTYLLYTIKNARAAKKSLCPLADVGIIAVDSRTLRVELERPSPHFLQIVASSVMLPVHEKCMDGVVMNASNTICNGPFLLKEWKTNQELLFVKNKSYHNARKVKLKRIGIDIIDRELAVLHMYVSGYFDVIGTPLSFFPAMLHQDFDNRDLLTFFPAATTKFLGFNTESFPFSNTNIRRAFALAIDRQSIVDHITQLKEIPALNIIPPILLSSVPQQIFADADQKQAKEYLKQGLEELQCKIEDLPPITFMYCASEINYLIAQELQSRWSKVLGIPVILEQVEFKVLHQRSANGQFSIGIFAWLADYADPMNILERFEDKTNHRNYVKWENADYNRLLIEATKTQSQSEYLAKITAAERILLEEVPITCLFHSNYAFLIQPDIKNFAVSPLGHIYFEKISKSGKY